MAAPDLIGYLGLVIYDRDPYDLADRAIADVATKLPELIPRAGDLEVVLIEAGALIVGELVYAINRVPNAVVDAFAGLVGLERLPGARATATLTLRASDDLGHEFGAGVRARLELGDSTVDFVTDAGVVIAAGATEGNVAATAVEFTDDANAWPAGTVLVTVDPVPYLEQVRIAVPPAGGADPETEAEWRDRAVATFARQTTTLVRPEHFTAAALDDPAVVRATTVDRYDPAVGPAPGDNLGHVTVAVLGAGGGLLSAGAKTALEAVLEAEALAALDVHVVDPTITTVAVTVTVRRLAGVDSTALAGAVADALEAYLDPQAWGWADTVRRFELVSLIDQVPGVDYVETLTLPAADVGLAGVAPLAGPGAMSVTVTAPPP